MSAAAKQAKPPHVANMALASIMVDRRPRLNAALRRAYVNHPHSLYAVPEREHVETVVREAKDLVTLAEYALSLLPDFTADGGNGS